MTTRERTIFDELKARGEEFFAKMGGELMSNPNFTRAMQAAWWTKEKLDQAVTQALRNMRIPTREEFHRALRRLDALETEVERLKLAAKGSRPAARAARSGTAGAASPPARRRPSARKTGGGSAED